MALDDQQKPDEEPIEKKLEIRDLIEARAYQNWKKEAHPVVRRMVEGALLGKTVGKPSKDFTPLMGQFFDAFQQLLFTPDLDVESLEIDPRIKNKLKKIVNVALDEESFVNVFEILRNPEISFNQKLQWYKAQIESRLQWLQRQDAIPADPPAELNTVDDQDELVPGMNEMQESKEDLVEGFYEVMPFYGGYYRGHVFEKWDAVKLKWKKGQRELKEVPVDEIFAEGTVRTMRGKFTSGKFQVVDMPYGFGIDRTTVEGAKVLQDQNGAWYIKLSPENSPADSAETELEFKIGKLKKSQNLQGELNFNQPAAASLPEEVIQKIRDAAASNLPKLSKARLLCGFVRNHLEYSNDSSCNDFYRNPPSQYFEKMWNNKKADCDVANTFAAEVLRQAGIKVRMIGGHYVKSPSKAGSAILHGGSAHAWLEVFDEDKKKWERMDATPKGDPNMEEEEQEKDLQDPQEGDYGEEESEVMSDEDIQKLIEEYEKAPAPNLPEAPEIKFAKEAGCTVEEAKAVMQKIQQLRKLKDAQGRNVLQESKKSWHDVVKKNLKQKVVYTGPVRMHDGEDLDDVVMAAIDIKSGERNPLGFEKRTNQTEVQKYFGGIEVYVVADLSGSMGQIDAATGQKKSDSQRDCAFLFVDAMMANALEVKKNQRNLLAPMPVKICLVVFGATTEIVLPLTDEWGPKEQIMLYKALDKLAGGGTPDHEALGIVRQQIEDSKRDEALVKKQLEKTAKGRKNSKNWNMHRFVAVFADGGSDQPTAVRDLLRTMRDEGTVVHGFGVTQSGKAMEAVYAPDVVTVDNPTQLAEVGLKTLVKTIKKWYNI